MTIVKSRLISTVSELTTEWVRCPKGEDMYCKLIDPIAFRLAYKEKGFDQQTLAYESGVSLGTVHHIIAGDATSVDYVLAISKSLNLNIWDMFKIVASGRSQKRKRQGFVIKRELDLETLLNAKERTLIECSRSIGITSGTLKKSLSQATCDA